MPNRNHLPQHPTKTEELNPLATGCDNPYDFIENFLSNFELEEMDALLYKFLRCWLTSNDIEHLDSRGRDAIRFFLRGNARPGTGLYHDTERTG